MPGPVKPAREMLGDLLLELNKAAEALEAFKCTLQRSPNRFNALYGAAAAARAVDQRDKATQHFSALIHVSDPASSRPELGTARLQEVAQK